MTEHFRDMTDDEFAAWWDIRIEEAAQDGDETEVERLMLAYGDAFAERYPE